MTLVDLKMQELELWQRKLELQKGLPHLPENGWKLYKWAQEYWDSRNPMQLICAANQISKSSTQIRKHIHWATATDLWTELWPGIPRQFWYLYPTRDVAHIEFKKKWEPEFLPRGEFRHDHPQYGWTPEFYHNRIFAIHWNSGVSTYFKTYKQNVQDLQTGTVHKLDCDEEPPEEIMSELFLRLAAAEGFFSAVFTPTVGQEYWRQAMEERGAHERFKDAFKIQVSMWDCLLYADGTPAPWTKEKIQRAEAQCRSPQEVDMRINGKFVIAEGLKYPSFHRLANRKPAHPLPKSWSIYCGVDPGSGGDNHPAAIALVGVSPDWKAGRVFKGWRGDDGTITTAGDVVQKVIDMIRGLENVQIFYDWGCIDFYTIATQMGLQVERAEKSHVIGETMLNVLFKNQMLAIYDIPELDPLCVEFGSLKNATPKNKAKDDFIDAVRYAIAKVPWDWDSIKVDPITLAAKPEAKKDARRSMLEELEARRIIASPPPKQLVTIDDELSSWNDLMGTNDDDY